MACCQLRLSVVAYFPLRAVEIAVSAEYLLLLGVPHYELFVAVVTRVELVEVELLARSSACFAESYLAKSSYLAQGIGSIVGCDDVDFVVALVRHSQLLVGRKLASEQVLADWLYYFLFHDCVRFYC